MTLGKPVDSDALLRKMRGEELEPDVASPVTSRDRPVSPLNPKVVIVPAVGPRFGPPPEDTERDEILRKALPDLSEQGVEYVPIDIEEDIQGSYDSDSFEEFSDTVRVWVRALLRRQRGAA